MFSEHWRSYFTRCYSSSESSRTSTHGFTCFFCQTFIPCLSFWVRMFIVLVFIHQFFGVEHQSTMTTFPGSWICPFMTMWYITIFNLLRNIRTSTMFGAKPPASIWPVMGISTVFTFHSFTFSLPLLCHQQPHHYLQLYEKLSSNLLGDTMSLRTLKLARVRGFKPPGTQFAPRLNRPRRYQLRFTPE